MFKLENDITLLLICYISLIKVEIKTMGQHIRFPLLALRAICDDKLKLKQGQCPMSLVLIQNTSCHEILHIFMV
jgi:hypothetical protein